MAHRSPSAAAAAREVPAMRRTRNSAAIITTEGEKAYGIKAQSVGGGGGDGGLAVAGSIGGGAGSLKLDVSVGGSGGAGSTGGTVDVDISGGSIETSGKGCARCVCAERRWWRPGRHGDLGHARHWRQQREPQHWGGRRGRYRQHRRYGHHCQRRQDQRRTARRRSVSSRKASAEVAAQVARPSAAAPT
ncbi:MAG: hypothetical protein IPN64_13780 [Propionivibrio sp.]|uniref:hypothetical protein n=1 Tax=Propionivibrio sp. TaxID=2212460 RepID=UPI0025FF379A|nr:hypothetical protein [Propionivibrio sp.]MBK8895054.1 hypothetical protein [Propionivibrio sp.]